MKKGRVELLAPAGSYESMKAAVAAGADAVYIGGGRFGARAYADNPGEDLLKDAIDYAHLHGRRIYMTVNTLVKEEELGELYEYLAPYYCRGVDAVIVQDMGVFLYVKRRFPNLPIHVSTQMTITGAYGAQILAALGASRVVTARELSLREIGLIRRQTDLEIECFVHGALCYCYSGQCLFSSMVGGRSGNRGRCAQPCRLPYEVKRDGVPLNDKKNKYVLNLKDLCALDLIPDLLEAGVYSLKIEGRMKSPRYTAGVVSIYRKYVDLYLAGGREGYRVDARDKKLLLDLFDRGGFTEGYSRRHNGRDMIALKEKPAFREGNQALFDYLDERFVHGKLREPVRAWVELAAGKPSLMRLSGAGADVRAFGEPAQQAQNRPLSVEQVEKQMNKTGDSPFRLDGLEVRIDGEVFLPVQALNELRRAGLARLEEEALAPFRRKLLEGGAEEAVPRLKEEAPASWPPALAASLEKPEVLNAVLQQEDVSEVYVDSTGFAAGMWRKTAAACHRAGKKCLLILPHIFRTEARDYFQWKSELLLEADFDGVVVRSLEEKGFLEERGIRLPMVFDYGMYAMNRMAAGAMKELGAARLTLPVELNSRELAGLPRGGELIAYGHIPMMVTAQCIQKTVEGCRKESGVLWLRDRLGKEFPVKNHCSFCYNTIYNSAPLSLLGSEEAVRRLSPSHIRLQFTIETEKQTSELIRAFGDGFLRGQAVLQPVDEYTRGHFKRGIE